MLDSTLLSVLLGLVIGIGFIIIISLALKVTILPKEPIMVMTTDDGKSYRAYINEFCDGACDLLAYARVSPPDPPIHINKESEVTFRITNSIEQPKTIRFYLPNYELGLTVGLEEVRATSKHIIDLDSGQYILDVLAIWNDSEDQRASLHRFKIIID